MGLILTLVSAIILARVLYIPLITAVPRLVCSRHCGTRDEQAHDRKPSRTGTWRAAPPARILSNMSGSEGSGGIAVLPTVIPDGIIADAASKIDRDEVQAALSTN